MKRQRITLICYYKSPSAEYKCLPNFTFKSLQDATSYVGIINICTECINLRQKRKIFITCHLPLSAFVLFSASLPLIQMCQKYPPKASTALNFTVRLPHDSSDMYVCDAVARKDRLLLPFTSAVGCYCHSNTVMLML